MYRIYRPVVLTGSNWFQLVPTYCAFHCFPVSWYVPAINLQGLPSSGCPLQYHIYSAIHFLSLFMYVYVGQSRDRHNNIESPSTRALHPTTPLAFRSPHKITPPQVMLRVSITNLKQHHIVCLCCLVHHTNMRWTVLGLMEEHSWRGPAHIG